MSNNITKKYIVEKFEEEGLKPSSAKIYMVALVSIVKKMGDGIDILHKPTAEWFDVEKFNKAFDHLKKTSKRNYISSVVAWMKVKKEEKTKLYSTLSNSRDEYNQYYERMIKTGEKTDYEKAMWVEPDALRNAFANAVYPFLQRMNFDSIRKPLPKYLDYDPGEIKKIRNNVILAIYLYPFYDKESNFGVIRNDVATLHLATSPKNITPGKNSLVFGKGGAYLKMVDYKTHASHGDIEIKLPPTLSIILKRWCQFSQKENGEKVFMNLDKHHITEILQKGIERLVGKGVGVQMLRKIYVSWRFGKEIDEEKEVADSMMHTLSTQQNVYSKK
jgi:hypothetical protein